MSEDKKYAQLSNESIRLWAETVGIVDLNPDTLSAIGSDATFRLHQVINVCLKYLLHSNRRRLTSEDFNRALKLMDVTPVMGYSGGEASDWISVPELGVFVAQDSPVNLASTALSGDIFHQPGNTFVKGKWEHVSGHMMVKNEGGGSEEKSLASLPLSSHLVQYYRTLFSVITNPSVKLFETMCEDVGTNPNINPLVGFILRSVLKGAQKASQKPMVLRRLLKVVRSLIFNDHVHLGPQNYIHDIVNVLVFSVVTERKNSQDTQSIRNLAANILLKLSRKEGYRGSAWELAVISLSGVIGSSTRPWTQHAGALTGLIHLGFSALHRSLVSIASEYYTRLSQTLSNSPSATLSSAIIAKDTLDANMTSGLLLVSFVNMMFSLLKSLPDDYEISVGNSQHDSQSADSENENSERDSVAETVRKIKEVYFLGEEMFGSAFVLQVPPVYLYKTKNPSSDLYSEYPKSDLIDEEFSDSVPPQKRRKMQTNSESKLNRFFERDDLKPRNVFINYYPIIPVNKRKIYMCIRGCSTRKFEYLKQRPGSLPVFKPHPERNSLIEHNKNKMISRMPHWTFITPMKRKILPSSLNYLIL